MLDDDEFDDILGTPSAQPQSAPPGLVPASAEELPAEIKEAALAALLGINSSRVRTLARDGVFVKSGRGKFDFSQSLQNYVTRLRESVERAGRPSAGGDEIKAEKLRLTRAQADKEETRVARERGDLVPADAVSREWAGILRDLRNTLLAVPSRCGASLPHLTSTDVATLDRETLLGNLLDYDASTVNTLDRLTWRKEISPLIDPRITDRSIYLLADPAQVAVFNIAHLAAAPGPQIQRSAQWDQLGVSFRCWMDCGVGFAGWRGAVKIGAA